MRYAILTDLNRCVGCLSCSVACKAANKVPIGQFWNKVMRVGPFPTVEGGTFDQSTMYFLPMTCQHCENAPCIDVCPTGASMKLENGIVAIDPEMCIGCQSCMAACPYGVRYLNDETNVVEKCTLCQDKVEEGELPACVMQCCARARFFGDLDEGIDSFQAPGDPSKFFEGDKSYENTQHTYVTFAEYCKEYADEEVYHLPDDGNAPSFAYVLRNREWQGL